MEGGAPGDLEARIRQLETAVSDLVEEYAATRARLRDLERATGATGTSDERDAPASRAAAGRPRESSPPSGGREATQAEVERAIERVEAAEDGDGDGADVAPTHGAVILESNAP
ncbi:MAG: hypothetical protein ABEJ23_07805 [Haloarculaceae archaeon]